MHSASFYEDAMPVPALRGWFGEEFTLVQQETFAEQGIETTQTKRSWLIGLSSFFFVLLQSACAAVTALSGLRLLIGIGSLAAATAGIKFLVALHIDAIRIPMLLLAVAGSVINLYVLWRIRSLRARSASSWRAVPVTPQKKRAEAIQIALAVLTLLLVAIEVGLHLHYHGRV
jgi:hypothetical protein